MLPHDWGETKKAKIYGFLINNTLSIQSDPMKFSSQYGVSIPFYGKRILN